MYRTYNFRPISPPSPCFVLPGAIAKGLSPIKLKPETKNNVENRTTDHYSHWYDNKSCNGRINSGSLKDNMLGNIEVPSLYTAVTPKSFIPPSPLRTKQFVMPLKLQQLEPQKKPIGNSDLTVTFVHRKMSESNGTVKNGCNKTSGSTSTAAQPTGASTTTPTTTTSKPSQKTPTSSSSSSKQKHSSEPQQPGYPDPTDNAPIAFINRLAEMTSHQMDTVRLEKSKRGKVRTRVS